MSETKHTPGPWNLEETLVEAKWGNPSRWVCEITCPDRNLIVAEIPEYRSYPEETPMVEANARLIAAAPELLAELIRIHDYDVDQGHKCDAGCIAAGIIAKATGSAA